MGVPGGIRLTAAAAVCAVLLAACSKSATTTSPSSTPSATPSASPTLSGAANVFAAQSLTGSFNKMKTEFTTAHPGVNLTMNYNGSGMLVTQIQQGGPADVFASADTANMTKLTSSGYLLTSTVKVFARNRLQMIVKSGNPKGITTLADLAKPGVVVVLGDPASVPAGKYAMQAFTAAGVKVSPKSLETNVAAVAQKVALGEADAGIVYVTNVKEAIAAGQAVEGVDIPDAQNVIAVYPIAPLKAAPNPAVGQAFIDYVLSPAGQADLASFGFLPPS